LRLDRAAKRELRLRGTGERLASETPRVEAGSQVVRDESGAGEVGGGLAVGSEGVGFCNLAALEGVRVVHRFNLRDSSILFSDGRQLWTLHKNSLFRSEDQVEYEFQGDKCH